MRLVPLVALLLLSACGARRTGEVVTSFEFAQEGEHAVRWPARMLRRPSKRALLNAMAHPRPNFQSLIVPGIVEPAWLDRPTLDEDAWRLEVWYANQGYFDARVNGWEIRTAGSTRKRMKPVRVIAHVDEGLPSRVRSVTVRGIETLFAPMQRRIRGIAGTGGSELAEGDVFTRDDYRDALDTIEAELLQQSYAHVKVRGEVAVHADEQQVDVTIDISPGPRSKFGAITVEGLSKIPEPLIREQLTFEEGEPYDALALEKSRSKLHALRVFGLVDLVPDLTDPTSPIVPVRVHVTETKTRELRAGPIIEIESGKTTAALQATVSDQNLFHRLWRVYQDTRVGVGVVAGSVQEVADLTLDDVKPVLELAGGVELPHLVGTDVALLNEGRLEVGLEPGYRFFSPSFTPTLVYTGFEKVRLSVGYRIRYFDYFDTTVDLAAIEDSPLGLDLTDPYLLSLLEQKIVVDTRNDPIDPRRGWYGSLAVAEAGGPFGGNFSFLRTLGEVRAYRAVVQLGSWDPDLVFAVRLGGGVILPYGRGAEASVPYAERLYLGGANTVRGWGSDRLGPYVCTNDVLGREVLTRGEGVRPTRPAVQPDCDTTLSQQLPAGGELQTYGSLEARKGLPLGLTLALFADAGRVWDDPEKFNWQELQVTVGGGLRYSTPIGPIRLDIGYRLGDPDYFAAQPRWIPHFSIGEAF